MYSHFSNININELHLLEAISKSIRNNVMNGQLKFLIATINLGLSKDNSLCD